jgi:hypothetical protein
MNEILDERLGEPLGLRSLRGDELPPTMQDRFRLHHSASRRRVTLRSSFVWRSPSGQAEFTIICNIGYVLALVSEGGGCVLDIHARWSFADSDLDRCLAAYSINHSVLLRSGYTPKSLRALYAESETDRAGVLIAALADHMIAQQTLLLQRIAGVSAEDIEAVFTGAAS